MPLSTYRDFNERCERVIAELEALQAESRELAAANGRTAGGVTGFLDDAIGRLGQADTAAMGALRAPGERIFQVSAGDGLAAVRFTPQDAHATATALRAEHAPQTDAPAAWNPCWPVAVSELPA